MTIVMGIILMWKTFIYRLYMPEIDIHDNVILILPNIAHLNFEELLIL